MPLLDRFRPPTDDEFYWESFHLAWAVAIMGRLSRSVLPRESYRAQAQVHIGPTVEVDVATFERASAQVAKANGPSDGVALATWAPPAAPWSIPVVYPAAIEVHVFDRGSLVPVPLGEPLPVLPLRLRNDLVLPLDWEATYAEARTDNGLD
jgi:hypothetical protein